uniref:Integrase n=1 Tax=Ascaris lumbricoides TaxID=6252 RepID=A0A0M3HM91_ASCLU
MSNYVKPVNMSSIKEAEKVDLNDVMLRQNRILHNTGKFAYIFLY